MKLKDIKTKRKLADIYVFSNDPKTMSPFELKLAMYHAQSKVMSLKKAKKEYGDYEVYKTEDSLDDKSVFIIAYPVT